MTESEMLYRVRSKTDPLKLGASLVIAWREGKRIKITAIGFQAISQAFKAVCTANRALASQGVFLAIVPGMEDKELEDKVTGDPTVWTAATMRLVNIMDKVYA